MVEETTLNVLVIEDSQADMKLIERSLKEQFASLTLRRVASSAELEASLSEGPWDIVLTDFSVPGMDFRTSLQFIHERTPALPVILVSGSVGEEQAVALIKEGVWDFVLKDNLVRLAPAIRRGVEEAAQHQARAAAERALRESEERFRGTLENMMEGCQIIGRDWRYLYVNEAAARHGRRAREELLGRTMLEVFPGIETTAMFAGLRRAMDQRIPGRMENQFTYPDGSVAWFDLSFQPVPEGLFILSYEITQRKNAEAALIEAEAALRTLVNAIPESAILFDVKGTVLAANETVARRLGKVARQMIGENLYDLFPVEVSEARRKRIEECIRTGAPVHFEDSRLGRRLDNYVHPITDAEGRVRLASILGVDVTERKEAEQRLAEQAALLDIASDAILVKDMDNRILYWNKSAQRIYGWSAAEVIGKDEAGLLFSPDNAQEPARTREETISKGGWQGDLHQRTKDGKDLIVEGRLTLVRDEKGTPKGVLSVNSDVTSPRAVQAQLLRSQRLESLGTLAGGIAHDLNNVLSPILMGVEGLSFHDPDAATRNILEIIRASARRGADIVRQVLNFARGMEGKQGEIQVKHVLREIEGIIRETFEKSIEVTCGIPKDLWPVTGDATQLHQVLMNLCVNARDAMPNGGQLALSAENMEIDEAYAQMNVDARPMRYVVLNVDDTGDGMSAEVLEKMFDPFFTTKEPGRGTGLGLSTVRSIVKSHGGFITVSSTVGRGTSFKVHIPAVDQGLPADQPAAEKTFARGRGELVLLAEDEVSLRDITRQVLESFGYQVATAADGTDAITKFADRRREINLVITDMMMPYMDGPATIRALRKIDPGVRIIAMSGSMSGSDEKEAMSLGAIGFLAKPFTADRLLQTVRDALDAPGAAAPP